MAQTKDVEKIVRGPAAIQYAGNTIGYITKQTMLKLTQTYLDCEVEDSNGIVKSEVIKEEGTLSFNLQQADAESFKMALGQTANVTGFGDAANVTPVTITVTFGGKVFTCHKCVPTGGLNLNIERGAWTEIPVEFKLLSDMTKSAGERLCTIADA